MRSRRALQIASGLLLFLSSAALLTCGKDGPTNPTPAPEPPRPAKIAIAPTTPAPLTSTGQTVRLTATVTDQHGNTLPGTSITWKSSNAAVATVNSAGTVTAVRNGSATITAAAGNVTAAVQVQVALSSMSIIITPAEPEVLTPGQTLRLETEAKDQNGIVYRGLAYNWGITITWSSSDTSVATVNAKGVVTAVREGSAVITAAAANTGGARVTVAPGTVQVRVAAPATIAIMPAEPDTLRVIGQTLQLTATVRDQHGNTLSGTSVTWRSSNTEVATVNDSGLVTAARTGSATITAAAGNIAGTVQVQVALPVPTTIAITPAEPDTLRVIGQTLQLTATVRDQNGNTLSGTSVTWRSSNTEVATVNDSGLVTAARTGSATITAAAGTVAAAVQVQVALPVGPARIIITPMVPDTLTVDQTLQLIATVIDLKQNVSSRFTVVWTSSDDGVATVNASGLVTALSSGSATIEARISAQPGEEGGHIASHVRVTVKAPPSPDDRAALVAFYNSTNGPNWANNTNWLTDTSVLSWYGVNPVHSENRVTRLELQENRLQGAIPPEISLLSLVEDLWLWGNQLTSIPAEIGQLKNLKVLSLDRNRLTSIPPEIGQLKNLEQLEFYHNDLTSTSIPPEIGQLKNLKVLSLGWNRLTSFPAEILQLSALENLDLERTQITDIPAEIGQMSALRQLIMQTGQLTGSIPPEIGQLKNLEDLGLNVNQLTGPIPPEIGQLENLRKLNLHQNQLTGSIPPEIGQLVGLERLSIHTNQLTGSIPPEIGQLKNLQYLAPGDNQLTGPIPPEIGGLVNLEYLILRNNQLTGSVPPEIGRLRNLIQMNLAGNPGLFGPLPREITTLTELSSLTVDGTQLCAPKDPEFDDFLKGLVVSRVPRCGPQARSVAYLTQATQSITYPVPLVAGEDALLRVFVLADEEVVADMPPVRATFYNDGAEVRSVEIRAQVSRIPSLLDEGSLASSANALVPGSIIAPGLELVVDIDPEETLEPLSGVQSRIPEAGGMAIEVLDVPPLNLTIIPLVWSEDPDLTVVTETEGLTPEDDLFRFTQDLLPVRDFHLRRLEPVYTSVNPVFDNSTEAFEVVRAIQKTDGRGGHYMGILSGLGGTAAGTTALTLSGLAADNIAHELGHNMSLRHAPCNVPSWDPAFPYPEGNVGAWGYDFLNGELVSPDTPDLMTYCGPPDWISDYNFSKAIRYRQTEDYMKRIAPASSGVAARTLLLWGRVDQSGDLVLNPAFVVDAAVSTPTESGPYRITGENADGRALFSFDFDMEEIDDGEGAVFAYTIPVAPSWRGRLDRISLSGPEGLATVDARGDAAMGLLLDRFTGQVRGFLRDLPVTPTGVVSARRSLPEPGLEMVISRGVPDPSDW